MKPARLSHISVLLPVIDLNFKVFPFLWSGRMWLCPGLWITPTGSFSEKVWWAWKASGRRRKGGEKGGGEEAERGRERISRLYCCVFSHHQRHRKRSGAAKYTNGTMRWWARSSCGTRLSPHSAWRIPLIKPAERTPDSSTAPIWISLNPKVLCKENYKPVSTLMSTRTCRNLYNHKNFRPMNMNRLQIDVLLLNFPGHLPCPGHEGAGGLSQGKKQEEMLQTFFPHYSGTSGCGSYDLINHLQI